MPTKEEVKEWWNGMARRLGLRPIRALSASRWKWVLLRLKEGMWEHRKEIEQNIRTTPFLRGQNARGWKANFEFLFRNDRNWLKVIEGGYQDEDNEPGSRLD